jgi:hypothetical protein
VLWPECTQANIVAHLNSHSQMCPRSICCRERERPTRRLVTELQQSPVEAYEHLRKILEQVCALVLAALLEDARTPFSFTHSLSSHSDSLLSSHSLTLTLTLSLSLSLCLSSLIQRRSMPSKARSSLHSACLPPRRATVRFLSLSLSPFFSQDGSWLCLHVNLMHVCVPLTRRSCR